MFFRINILYLQSDDNGKFTLHILYIITDWKVIMNRLERNILAVIIGLLPLGVAEAASYEEFYEGLPVEVAAVGEVSIPDLRTSIGTFGGKGDGISLNTEAFREAISWLEAQGGGHLDVGPGVWLTGPIELKDNIDLHLDPMAIIKFSPDKSLFVDPEGKQSRVYSGIRASKRKNISITGEGIIDGNGDNWRPVKRSKVSDVEWKRYAKLGGKQTEDGSLWYPWDAKSGYPNIAESAEKQERMRNDLIRFTNCENIVIKDVTVQNAPKFHVHPLNCVNVIIDGITVRCPWNAQNGDGIDISDCHKVLVANCLVDVGDDGICLKSGEQKKGNLVSGCEDIIIRNNTVFHAHGGFVIGSEDVEGIRRVVVSDCRMSGTDTGLRFKSGIGRGGLTENIYINNVVMSDINNEAIIIECDYTDKPAGGTAKESKEVELKNIPVFSDINVSNITCQGASTAISAHGIEGLDCVKDIRISNSTFVYTKSATDIDEGTAKVEIGEDVVLRKQ